MHRRHPHILRQLHCPKTIEEMLDYLHLQTTAKNYTNLIESPSTEKPLVKLNTIKPYEKKLLLDTRFGRCW